jgi:hypothetical protein
MKFIIGIPDLTCRHDDVIIEISIWRHVKFGGIRSWNFDVYAVLYLSNSGLDYSKIFKDVSYISFKDIDEFFYASLEC